MKLPHSSGKFFYKNFCLFFHWFSPENWKSEKSKFPKAEIDYSHCQDPLKEPKHQVRGRGFSSLSSESRNL